MRRQHTLTLSQGSEGSERPLLDLVRVSLKTSNLSESQIF
jgi:hypothetical protein